MAPALPLTAHWRTHTVELPFRLGECTLWRWCLPMQVCALSFRPDRADTRPAWPAQDAALARSLPVERPLPRWRLHAGWIEYVPAQYARFYIALTGSFDDYLGHFSAKTRATLRRKLRKFAELSGGRVDWRIYPEAGGFETFYRFAQEVSARSYQSRLLDCGLPEDAGFRTQASAAMVNGEALGFVLLHDARPVAYLYTPVDDGVLSYRYMGYDPDYAGWSVGTVLQYLVLEWLFAQSGYRMFDFTAGEGPHKRLFATGSRYCADIYRLRATPRHVLLSLAHLGVTQFSDGTSRLLDRIGIKRAIKQWLRRRAG